MLENNIDELCNYWKDKNNNLKLKLGNIRAYFQKSFYEFEHAHILVLYGNLHGLVSRESLRCIAEKFFRVKYVTTDNQICECTLITSYGLCCTCELRIYLLYDDSISIDINHIHWRKLSMED